MNKEKLSTEERTHMDVLHAEHVEWLNKLDFYAQDLELLKNRLAEVSVKNNSPEERQGVEQYQNKFIREKEVIDTLVHDIKAHENGLIKAVEENPLAATKGFFEYHSGLADRMTTYEKLFAEMKGEFNRFLAKWM